MQIIPSEKIDVQKWDALVATDERGPYDYSWYLSVVSEKWYILVDENYTKGVAFATSTRLGIENVTVAPFVREHQFYGKWTENEVDNALNTIQKRFSGGVFQTNFPIKGTKRTYQIVETLQLQKHAERNIRKAAKNEAEIVDGTDVLGTYQLVVDALSGKIAWLDGEKQEILKKLFLELQKRELLRVKEMRQSGQVLGGLFFFQGKNRVVYLKGGVNEVGKSIGGMYLTMATQIEETLAQGKMFDFDGSEVPGVKRFNTYFGGKDAYYYQLTWDKNPFWYRLARKIYLKLKK